jgi:hypothetical protein
VVGVGQKQPQIVATEGKESLGGQRISHLPCTCRIRRVGASSRCASGPLKQPLSSPFSRSKSAIITPATVHDHAAHALRIDIARHDAVFRHPPPDRLGHAEPLLLGGAPIRFGCVCPPRGPPLRHRRQRSSSHRLSGCRCPQVCGDELPGDDISTPGAYERRRACCVPLTLLPHWILLPSLWQMLPHVAFFACPQHLSRPYSAAPSARRRRHETHSLDTIFELSLDIVATNRGCRIWVASQTRGVYAHASIRRVLIRLCADPVVDLTRQQTTERQGTAEGV